MKLSPAQKEILTYRGGPLCVRAVAGAGKTTCLLALAEKLVDKYPPHRVGMFVFNKNNAEELATRVTTSKKPRISTIHSLMFNIYREYFGKTPGVVQEWEKIAFFRKKVQKQHYSKIHELNRYISMCKNLGIRPSEQVSMPLKDTDIYAEYEMWLGNIGKIDFEDMCYKVYTQALTDTRLQHKLSTYFDVVMVDEAQDLTPVTYWLYSKMTPNLVLVGDPNQAIYGFQGSTPELFASHSKKGKTIDIADNFRSGSKICEQANSVANQQFNNLGTNLITTKAEAGKVEILTDKLSNAIMDHCQKETLTILASTNLEIAEMEHYLQDMRIPYSILNSESFYEKTEIKVIRNLLEFWLEGKLSLSYLKALYNVFHSDGKALYIAKQSTELWKVLDHVPLNLQQAAQRFLDLPAEAVMEEIITGDIVGYVKRASFKVTLSDIPPTRILLSVLERCPTNHPDSALEYLRDRLLFYRMNSSSYQVLLSTIHKAKGCEWEKVLVLTQPGSTQRKVDDEYLRLLYVACTRAKTTLIVFRPPPIAA